MVCLSGQELPADTRQGDVTLQVDDKELVPLDATSHLAVFVDIDTRHQAKLRRREGQAQVLEVDFKQTPNGSACLRYDPDHREWAITPSDKRNVCLDCAPDWVHQEPAYTSPSTGKEQLPDAGWRLFRLPKGLPPHPQHPALTRPHPSP